MPRGKGFISIINLSFDARKLIFDFRQNPQAGFRIWQVNVDGSGLHQILLPPKDEAQKVKRRGRKWHTDNIHPCYMPDGTVIFFSNRSEHTVLCGGQAAFVAPSLHRMDADGNNIEQLTKSPDSKFCPVVGLYSA